MTAKTPIITPVVRGGGLFKKYHLTMEPALARTLIARLESLDVVSEVMLVNQLNEHSFEISVGFSEVVGSEMAEEVIDSQITHFLAA